MKKPPRARGKLIVALAQDLQQLVAAVVAQVGHVNAARFAYPQPSIPSSATRAWLCGPSWRAAVSSAAYSGGCSTVRR